VETATLSDFLTSSEFSIPLGQVALLVVVTSLCLISGKHKLGLLTSFAFAFYWGFIFNRENFFNIIGDSTGLYIYGFCGAAMLGLAVVGFLQDPS